MTMNKAHMVPISTRGIQIVMSACVCACVCVKTSTAKCPIMVKKEKKEISCVSVFVQCVLRLLKQSAR